MSSIAAGYYDKAGVMRDMFQNHLLQLLSLVAIEPPAAINADALRNEKVKVLSALRPVSTERYGARRSTKATSDAQGVAPEFADADLRGDQALHRQLALAGRAVLPALRQGAQAARPRKSSIQFRRPPHLFFNLPRGRSLTRTCSACAFSRTRGFT